MAHGIDVASRVEWGSTLRMHHMGEVVLASTTCIVGMPTDETTSKRTSRRRDASTMAQEARSTRRTCAGIVYMSHVPPKLTPSKLRRLLEAHGDVSRLYLAPKALVGKHVADGNFAEGWIEFADEKAARRVAKLLNGTAMGGRRRSAHVEDLWTLRHVPGLTWDQLTEDVAMRKATRKQKLQMEVAAARAEGEFYVQHVQRKKNRTKKNTNASQEGAVDAKAHGHAKAQA